MNSMRVAICVKAQPKRAAGVHEEALRRLCRRRGWECSTYAEPPVRQREHGRKSLRLSLIEDLLHRRYDAVAVWHVAMLGNAIDDLLWTLNEVHIKRGIHMVAPGDGIDTTQDDSMKKVLKALAKVG